MVFDITFVERKRHKRAIGFYQRFKNYELRVSGKVFFEVQEIMTKAYATLSAILGDAIKHLEATGKDWDDLNVGQKRKLLLEVEDSIIKNKQLQSDNLLDFVLDGFHRLESLLVYYSFEELLDIILEIPADMTDEMIKKVGNIFVTVMFDDNILNKKQMEYYEKVDADYVSNHFNPRSDGKDKDIIVEIIILGSHGSGKEKYLDIEFFTEDRGFKRNYEALTASLSTNDGGKDETALKDLLKAVSSISVNIAY